MKRLLTLIFSMLLMATAAVDTHAADNQSQAKAILDKTAKVIAAKGGASANFVMAHPTGGKTSGKIFIKGNKFHAQTPEATVWYDGKTQWTYMKGNDEVNVTTPTQAQQQMMNPYTFITMYKSGYSLSSTTKGSSYEVHLTATNGKQSIQELYVTVSKSTYVPSAIRMKHGGKWYSITISGFSAKNLSDGIFKFNAKDFPSAEIIDLR